MKKINNKIKDFIDLGFNPKNPYERVNGNYKESINKYFFYSNENYRGVLYKDFAKIHLDKLNKIVYLSIGDFYTKNKLSLTQKNFLRSVIKDKNTSFKYVVEKDNFLKEVESLNMEAQDEN